MEVVLARWLCLGGQRTRQAEEVVQPPPASAADAAAQVKPAVMFHFTASGAVLPLPLTMSVNSVCNRRPFAPEPSGLLQPFAQPKFAPAGPYVQHA